MPSSFGAAQSFGAISGWNEQNSDSTIGQDRAFTLSKDGNETDSKVFNQKTEVSVPYKANTDGTIAIPGTIGAVLNSTLLTQIRVNTKADDYADMTLSGHQHAVNPHVAGAVKTGTHAIPSIYGFGAHCFLGGTAGTTSGGILSSSLDIKCEHKDVVAGIDENSGTQAEGDNCHCVIECETVWNGVPEVTSDGSWDLTITAGTKTNNQDAKTTTVRGTKTLALA